MKSNIIDKALKSLNIQEHFIIIHSNLLAFFKKTDHNPKKVWDIIYDNYKDKTIIMPAFTFSICKNKKIVWDYKKTKSETGSLTEFFRNTISLKRTIHPIHSVSIFGPNYKEIPDHNCKSSFGAGSTWEWLSNNKNVCNLSMGIGLNGGATICHYPEQKHKVDYRYFKFFKAKIIDKKKNLSERKYSYYTRIKNKKFEGINNWKKCEIDLMKNKILKQIKINEIIFQKMNCFNAVKFIAMKLNKNPNYLGKLKKLKVL
tara:strand:+ start:14 stop:787 length:774 start_codon:yes stop_codon:yes gene_type:complete